MKKIFLISLMVFMSIGAIAQESGYVLKLSSEVKASSGSSPTIETHIIGSGNYTIPEGVVSDSSGNVLTPSQISRLQEIIDNSLYDYLNLRVQPVNPFLPNQDGAFTNNSQEIFLPEIPTSIELEGVVTAQLHSWSGDNDASRLFVQARDADANNLSNILFQDYGNWGYMDTRQYNVVIPLNTSYIRFYASCYRHVGTECSAGVYNLWLDINPDLPEVGEEITVELN